MSQASNFTVNDGATTPVATLFTSVQPASGNLPATYMARTKGPSSASQPTIAISSSGKKGSREVRQTIRTPYYVTGTDGVTRVQDAMFTEIRTVLPDSVPDAVRADHYAYVSNSVDIAQIKESMKDGYAPA